MSTADDGDDFGLVAIFISRFPECFRGIVREAADHGLPAGRFNVNAGRQVLHGFHAAAHLLRDRRLVALVHTHRHILFLLGSRKNFTDVTKYVTSMQEHVVRWCKANTPTSNCSLLQR